MDRTVECLVVAGGLVFAALFLGMGYSEAEKEKAKGEIVVACYNSGAKNCEEVWK